MRARRASDRRLLDQDYEFQSKHTRHTRGIGQQTNISLSITTANLPSSRDLHVNVMLRQNVYCAVASMIPSGDPLRYLSGVNYFFSLTTIISPYQRQLLLDC